MRLPNKNQDRDANGSFNTSEGDSRLTKSTASADSQVVELCVTRDVGTRRVPTEDEDSRTCRSAIESSTLGYGRTRFEYSEYESLGRGARSHAGFANAFVICDT